MNKTRLVTTCGTSEGTECRDWNTKQERQLPYSEGRLNSLENVYNSSVGLRFPKYYPIAFVSADITGSAD
jgi:hypothetical protein